MNRSVQWDDYNIKILVCRSHEQIYIMLHRRLSSKGLIFLVILLPMMLAALQTSSNVNQKQQCQCFNGGTCSSNDKYIACNCAEGFVGTKCETQAIQISNSQTQTIITQDYAYFYFQPSEINYYQISLKICLPEGDNKKLTNLVFLEVERNSGKLKLQPSIYQTSPITFQGKQERCQTFYTHFIPIRKKINEQYQKIIFGVAIKNNSDSASNRWVNFLQKSLSDSGGDQSNKANELFGTQNEDTSNLNEPQIQTQRITISCSYQLYLAENYWGTAIIIMSALTLFISTGVFLYTIRNKYTYTISNDDILRLYAMNPEDIANGGQGQAKNDLSHFRLIMPIISYELLLQKQKRAQKRYPKNLLKRRIEMHQQRQARAKKCNQKQLEHSQQQKKGQDNQIDIHSQIGSTCKSQDGIISVQNVCTICLINFQHEQNIRQTPCRHVFHAQCIDNWCQNTLNCPICRHNLQLPHFMKKREFRALVDN